MQYMELCHCTCLLILAEELNLLSNAAINLERFMQDYVFL